MYIDNMGIVRGTKILVNGKIEEFALIVNYEDVDNNWDEAVIRGTGIAEEAIADWIDSIPGKIESISPLLLEISDIECINDIVKDQIKNTRSKINQQPNSNMVDLIFDASDSEERCLRILRANEEKFSFNYISDFVFQCKTQSNTNYIVSLDPVNSRGHCSCEDFRKRGMYNKMPCKHLYACSMNSIVKEKTTNKGR